jgi:membrane-associated phospholipid phosphatase
MMDEARGPDRPRPRIKSGVTWVGPATLRVWVTLGVSLALFFLFPADLLFHGPITSADPAISSWLHTHMQARATQFLFLFTHLHSTIGLIVMTLLIAVFLFVKKRASMIVWMVLTIQGGQVLNVAVKEAFHRSRPHFDDPLVQLATYSFPSGHAAGSTVFWGFACVLACAWPAPSRLRNALMVIAPLMVAFTCLSRVYLGAHYFSDVLAGVCEGIAWVCVCELLRARTMRA